MASGDNVVAVSGDRIVSVSGATGRQLWSSAVPENATVVALLAFKLVPGTVFACFEWARPLRPSPHNTTALDADTGRELWTVASLSLAEPTYESNTHIVRRGAGVVLLQSHQTFEQRQPRFTAYDAATGAVSWNVSAPPTLLPLPAYWDTTLAIPRLAPL